MTIHPQPAYGWKLFLVQEENANRVRRICILSNPGFAQVTRAPARPGLDPAMEVGGVEKSQPGRDFLQRLPPP